jgi:general secretion pathway protein M
MNFFQNLGTREKIFIMGAGVAILLALLFLLVVDPMLDHAARLDRQIVSAQRELQELHTLQREYQRQKSVLDGINAQLKRQKNSPAIFSRLEELAGRTGIQSKIVSMRQTPSVPSGAYVEESIEIKMEGVTLEQLVQYLSQIENSPQFLKIKRLSLNPNRDNRQLLTATFRVSTFTPKEGTT